MEGQRKHCLSRLAPGSRDLLQRERRFTTRRMQKIRLLLISKYQIVRSALRHLLAPANDIEIVGETETPQQAEQAISKLHPRVVLVETVDANNPAIPKLAEKIGRSGSRISVVVLSNSGTARAVRAMLRAGVTSYLLKDSSEAELLLALRSAAHGRRFLDPALIDELAFEDVTHEAGRAGKHVLSKRELQVLKTLVQGYTSSEIAKQLRLSIKTVETYRSRIYLKLKVRSRSDLMRYAISAGLISVNEELAG